MDTIYILTGLSTVIAAIGGLILTCHLERRSLTSRRNQARKQSASPRSEGSQATT